MTDTLKMSLAPNFQIPPIPVQAIEDDCLERAGVRLSVLRLDLVDPVISGNKWFKLKYNLARANDLGQRTVLSFGGAWSNHLHALAETGRQHGFQTIGLVRGDIPCPLNACLQDASDAGMQLIAVDRTSYAQKHLPEFLAQLRNRFGDFYLVPEGGANREGILGCAEVASLYDQDQFDLVCLSCGTGTMLAGMASASRVPLLGFQALKAKGYLETTVNSHFRNFGISPVCPWSINEDFHFGGFARINEKLMRFLTVFEDRHDIPLEPVYSAKMLFGLYEMINKRDFFPRNCSILVVHGGGLQGRRGYEMIN